MRRKDRDGAKITGFVDLQLHFKRDSGLSNGSETLIDYLKPELIKEERPLNRIFRQIEFLNRGDPKEKCHYVGVCSCELERTTEQCESCMRHGSRGGK